ncbi:MAG: hypothetical protein L0Z62_27020 [Gemmataceae bacterium]|nr:hypothetical protein [Gemmataceae bacterium]
MEKPDQASTNRVVPAVPAGGSAPPQSQQGSGCCGFGRRVYQLVGLGLAAVALLIGLLLFLRVPPPPGGAQDQNPTPPELKGPDGLPMFRGWSKPDVAILLSGQQFGYYQPCGCSDPQHGGLVRRSNFLQMLKARGWPVVAVDLGDIADRPQRGGLQTLLKYEYSMKALKLMDYTAVSFGRNEIALPLQEAMAHYALNNPRPRVVGTNLQGRDKKGEPFFDTVAGSAVGAASAGPKVGVLALAGPSLERDKDIENTLRAADIKFHRNTPEVLRKGLADLKAGGAELVVLLYQGTIHEAEACAKFCAEERRKANPPPLPVSVILCLEDADGAPPATAEEAGDSLIVRVGPKGQYVGVVGASRTGRADHPWNLRFQLARMSPEYATPKGKEAGHPVMALIEEYALRVKDGGFLARRAARPQPHPIQLIHKNAEYVGSAECRACHAKAYKIWKGSKHSHAYEALEKVINPKHRQYDPECVMCHVTGFGHPTGFVDEQKTPTLKHIGCESCHGPCSPHLDNPKDAKIYPLINPFKAPPNEAPQARQRRENLLDVSCQKCHDQDNDVNWQFPRRWADVAHPTPKKGQ